MLWLLWFVLGSCVGSFLNVCIYRMPREQSIVRPPSRCPKCERPIAWFDNIPILSFVLLRARCRHCRQPVSWRYPIVESLTGIATVTIFSRFGVTPVAMVYAAFVYGLIVCSVIDLEFQIIPDEISVGGLVVGGGLLYLTGLLGDFIFRKESMGGGDIKLLAMAGSVLGWKLVTLTFFIAPVFALIPGLFVLLLKRSHVIPYGPFLSIGLVVSLFVGPELLRMSGIEETISLLVQYYFQR